MIAVAHEADLDEQQGVGTVDGRLELPLKVVRAAWSTHRSSSPLTVRSSLSTRRRRRGVGISGEGVPCLKNQPINRPPALRRSGGRVEQAVNYENCGDT